MEKNDNLNEFLGEEFDSNETLLRLFGEEYQKYIDQQKDSDYVVNPTQMEKLTSVLEYFYALAEKSNGKIEPSFPQPKMQSGGVTAYFVVMQLREEDIPAFCEALLKTSAVTIDATTDGHICVSVCIPNVFIPKT